MRTHTLQSIRRKIPVLAAVSLAFMGCDEDDTTADAGTTSGTDTGGGGGESDAGGMETDGGGMETDGGGMETDGGGMETDGGGTTSGVQEAFESFVQVQCEGMSTCYDDFAEEYGTVEDCVASYLEYVSDYIDQFAAAGADCEAAVEAYLDCFEANATCYEYTDEYSGDTYNYFGPDEACEALEDAFYTACGLDEDY